MPKTLAAARPDLPEILNDRAADIWEPLLAIASHIGGEWPKLATTAAIGLSGEENSSGDKIELLADNIKKVLDGGLNQLPTKDLIAALCADQERPWATYNRDKPIRDRQLAALLKPSASYRRRSTPAPAPRGRMPRATRPRGLRILLTAT
jgi:putative DNA primase/helicase